MLEVNGTQPHDAYQMLPEHMREDMRRYIHFGQPQCKFLRAVLCNQLVEAHAYADMINLHYIKDYAIFLGAHAPMGCFGSEDNYETWVRFQGMLNVERVAHHA